MSNVINGDVPAEVKQMAMASYYVECSVTGKHIPLDKLRYWNVELQAAYIGPEAVVVDHFYPPAT